MHHLFHWFTAHWHDGETECWRISNRHWNPDDNPGIEVYFSWFREVCCRCGKVRKTDHLLTEVMPGGGYPGVNPPSFERYLRSKS